MKLPARTYGYLLAFLSAAAGAVRYNLAIYANMQGFDYVAFLTYALGVGVLASGAHVLYCDGPRGFLPLRGKSRYALLYGVLMSWSTLSHFVALYYMNETLMISVAQSGILITIALAVWLLGERFTIREWIGTGIICAAVLHYKPWSGEVPHRTGFLIVMSGVVGGSLATVGAKRWVLEVPPRVMMVWRNAVALVVVTAYARLTGRLAGPPATLGVAVAVLAAGIVGPYLHGLTFLMALEHVGAAKAALMSRVQPVIVFVLSWVFLSSLPAQEDMASAALFVVGALWLVAARGKAGKA